LGRKKKKQKGEKIGELKDGKTKLEVYKTKGRGGTTLYYVKRSK